MLKGRIEFMLLDDQKIVYETALAMARLSINGKKQVLIVEGEVVDELGRIKVDGIGRLNRNMYVVEAVGNSMEPVISNGDFCVFSSNSAGSRRGKIVLTQHINFYDADNSGSYSIFDSVFS